MAEENPPPPLEVRALAHDRAGIQAEFQALTREQREQRKVEMGKELLKFIKHKAWRTSKFINSDDQEANLSCKYLDSELPHTMDPDTQEGMLARQEWIATYGGEVAMLYYNTYCMGYMHQRSYLVDKASLIGIMS